MCAVPRIYISTWTYIYFRSDWIRTKTRIIIFININLYRDSDPAQKSVSNTTLCIQLILLLIFLCSEPRRNRISSMLIAFNACKRKKRKENRIWAKHGYRVNRTVNAHIFKQPKFTRRASMPTNGRYAGKVATPIVPKKKPSALLKMKLRAGLFK